MIWLEGFGYVEFDPEMDKVTLSKIEKDFATDLLSIIDELRPRSEISLVAEFYDKKVEGYQGSIDKVFYFRDNIQLKLRKKTRENGKTSYNASLYVDNVYITWTVVLRILVDLLDFEVDTGNDEESEHELDMREFSYEIGNNNSIVYKGEYYIKDDIFYMHLEMESNRGKREVNIESPYTNIKDVLLAAVNIAILPQDQLVDLYETVINPD